MLEDVAWCVGANADPITLSSKALFPAVKRTGVKAILTGDGADELFGGYSRLADAMHDASNLWAVRYIDALAAIPRALRNELYADDYRRFIQRSDFTADKLEEQVRALVTQHGGDRLAALLAFEQRERLPTYHLARVDNTSMAHSVEARVPYLQPRVVRFANHIAAEHKINTSGVKRILYQAATDLVPSSILTREKQPFTLPVGAMLVKGQPLFELARRLVELNQRRSPRFLPAGGN